MKVSFRPLMYAALIVAPLAWIGCGDKTLNTAPENKPLPPDVQALHDALAPYSSLQLAKNAGYATAITDCMSNGDEGAMGVHFGNTTLFDAQTNPLTPEVLIYEPGTDGQMSLVGVEFLVPFTSVPKTAAPPELFGQKFQVNDVFGVWALHVWTHRSNPSGLFANWNPRVHC
jgi:hypothetical protein